ncbi:MAG: response regulator [Opitutales bacterium]|nr:response regulator [Opitutales bacterium]
MSKECDEIIIVDDEVNYAEMLTTMLRDEGFRAQMFTGGRETLEYLRNKPNALVVADYKMPELGGAEFIQRLREMHPIMPVIVISGHMNTKDLLSVANIGVTLVLEKPFEKDVLVEHVSRFASPVTVQAEALAPAPAPKQGKDNGGKPKASAKPYPCDNLRLAQSSALSKAFLQELWDALNAHGGANLALPLGGELELVVTDIEHWFKLDSPSLRLSPTMMKVEASDFAESKVLAMLDARYASSDLGDEITALRQKLPEGMPLLVVRRTDNARADGGLPLVVLPPLSQRMEDVATYSRAILERMGAASQLAPDAQRLLLNYPWPGNYYELMGALRRAVINGEGENIDSVMLAAAIAEGHGAAQAEAAIMTMNRYLTHEQAKWFDKEGCEDCDSAEKAAGLPKGTLYRELSLFKQPLIYPELLEE